MIVVPSEVVYLPKFTYLWTLGVGRFPDALRQRVNRQTALREIARCFLAGAGMTIPGELARVTGLSRPDAGLGNRALVAEGYATMLAPGMYQLALGVNGGRRSERINTEKRRNGRSFEEYSPLLRFSVLTRYLRPLRCLYGTGLTPNSARNARVKFEASPKPQSSAISRTLPVSRTRRTAA